MSTRSPELITKHWADFQRSLIAAHGSPMDNKEAHGILSDLLATARRDSLTNHVRTYPPKDLIVLQGVLDGPSLKSKPSSPTKQTGKSKDAATAAIDAL